VQRPVQLHKLIEIFDPVTRCDININRYFCWRELGAEDIFWTRSDRPWDPPSLLYNGHRIIIGGKAAEAWRWPPTTSRAEIKERVQLYLYSLSGPFKPVRGWTSPLPLSLQVILHGPGRSNIVT